jgi:hypothetical protein
MLSAFIYCYPFHVLLLPCLHDDVSNETAISLTAARFSRYDHDRIADHDGSRARPHRADRGSGVRAREQIAAAARKLADQKAEIRALTATLGERDARIADLKESLDEREKSFGGIRDELRAVSVAVQRDPVLKTNLNRWLVGCALGLSLAGLGCCPTPWEMHDYSDHARRAANGAWSGLIIGGGMGLVGMLLGYLLDWIYRRLSPQ